VNILPGRDGLVHISKLGNGKRIERVEDVLEVGQSIDVHVDEIDPAGKVVLTPVGEGFAPKESKPQAPAPMQSSSDAPAPVATPAAAPPAAESATVSFEDSWDEEAKQEFGDLGPSGRPEGPSGNRGPRRNNRR